MVYSPGSVIETVTHYLFSCLCIRYNTNLEFMKITPFYLDRNVIKIILTLKIILA